MRDQARAADPIEVQRLRALLARGGSASLVWRGRIVLAFLEGATYEQIRERFGGSPTSHSRWIRRFRERGLEGLRTRKRGPRKAPVREGLVEWLPEALSQSPLEHGLGSGRWTLETLQQLREHQTGERVSLESIRLALHRIAAGKTPSTARRNGGRDGRNRVWWKDPEAVRERSA